MTDHRKTAVYIRLSAEDDNVDGRAKKESDSVTSQRILLKSFVIDELGVVESDILEYVDDGVSGTHFKRATSSGQATFKPWRFSMVAIYCPASSSESCVPVSSQA